MKCNHILQHKKLILFFFRRGGAYIQLEQNELVVDFFYLNHLSSKRLYVRLRQLFPSNGREH